MFSSIKGLRPIGQLRRKWSSDEEAGRKHWMYLSSFETLVAKGKTFNRNYY